MAAHEGLGSARYSKRHPLDPSSRKLLVTLGLLVTLMGIPFQFSLGFGCGDAGATKSPPALQETLQQLHEARTRQVGERLRTIAQELDNLVPDNAEDPPYYYSAALAHESLIVFYVAHGERKQAKKELELALRHVSRALELDEASATAHALRADLYGWKIGLSNRFSRMFSGMKYGPKAERDLKRALVLDPNHPEVYLSNGRSYFHKPRMVGGSVEEAIKNFQRAVEFDPGCVEGWIWLGIARAKHEQREEAHQALEEALRLSPDSVWARKEKDKLSGN